MGSLHIDDGSFCNLGTNYIKYYLLKIGKGSDSYAN